MSYPLTNKDTFVHSGIISKIKDDSVVVSLGQNINCESCHAKGACGISESNTKEIEIQNSMDSFKINENVTVVLKKSLGLKAVFLAYIFPFILMFATLIVTNGLFKEWLAGLASLLVLIPYYLILYLLQNKLKRAFKISVVKYN